MCYQDRGEPAWDRGDEHDERGKDPAKAALEPARRADADQVTHDKPQIESTRMNQEALQDVRVSTSSSCVRL